MIEKKARITTPDGIHMKPSMLLVDEALKYKSNIVIYKNNQKADAKSFVEVTMLAAIFGEEVRIVADGEDEQKASEALEELISSNFYNYLNEIKEPAFE